MAKTDFKSVDEYIATHPENVQAMLQRVRSTIRKALPGAEEVISYQIPTYKLHGGHVVYFAGWKQHYSLYPATDRLVAAFKDELAPYKVTKGTIRFPLSQPVPAKLIERIAKFLAKETAEREGEAGRVEEAQVSDAPHNRALQLTSGGSCKRRAAQRGVRRRRARTVRMAQGQVLPLVADQPDHLDRDAG